MDSRLVWKPYAGLLIGVGATIAATLLRAPGWLYEGPPSVGWTDFCVLVLAALAGIAVLPLMLKLERPRGDETLRGGGSIFVVAMIGLSLGSMTLLFISPEIFNLLLREDRFAEAVSATCLFAGAALLLMTALAGRQRWPATVALLLGAFVMALIAFEEVSWFQRVVQVQTPEWLRSVNLQGELNFHNVATNEIENLYYIGAFALCVLGRFSSDIIGFPAKRLMPSVAVLAAGALACAISYDMWSIAHIQVAFFVSLAAVVAVALASTPTQRSRAILMWIVAATMIAVQGALLAAGHTMVRQWDSTELRETLIAIGLLAYAVEVTITVLRSRPALPNARPT